jgi:hypothetical protein
MLSICKYPKSYIDEQTIALPHHVPLGEQCGLVGDEVRAGVDPPMCIAQSSPNPYAPALLQWPPQPDAAGCWTYLSW